MLHSHPTMLCLQSRRGSVHFPRSPAGTSTSSVLKVKATGHASATRTLRVPRCFVKDGALEYGAEAVVETLVEAPVGTPLTMQNLCLALSVSNPTAFRLQQQYHSRTLEELTQSVERLQAALQVGSKAAAVVGAPTAPATQGWARPVCCYYISMSLQGASAQ